MLALGTLVLAAACTGRGTRPAPLAGMPAAAWPPVLAAGKRAAAAGDYRAAESTFAAFARQHPDASVGAEATYWWALVRLDPGNPSADRAAALPLLDAYRSTDPPRAHAFEAALVRALVAQQDSLRAALAPERAPVPVSAAPAARPALVPRDSLRVRDEEILRLRTEAAAAQAELARVRRRLAAPTGRPR